MQARQRLRSRFEVGRPRAAHVLVLLMEGTLKGPMMTGSLCVCLSGVSSHFLFSCQL